MVRKQNIEVNNYYNPKIRLNSICPYFTMFPLAFPYKILQSVQKGEIVYDPFCGRGTTNYASRLLGISSYGVDSNPIAFAVAQAKLVYTKPENIIDRCNEILCNKQLGILPEGGFWKWAYYPSTLIDICKLRNYFISKAILDQEDIALRAITLGILHGPKMKSQPSYLSNQMPRTFATKPDYSFAYWRRNNLKPEKVNLSDLIERKAKYIFNKELPKQTGGKIILGDSRTVKSISYKKFSWIVTSPPYFGMSTYEQDQWLRNWFMGGPSKVNYSNNSQLKHGSERTFIADLSSVWSNAAKKCLPDAKLVIRFGALPSKSLMTPADLIKESLKLSNCGWRLKTIRTAGEPMYGRRQANQFRNSTGEYVKEVDAFATLNI